MEVHIHIIMTIPVCVFYFNPSLNEDFFRVVFIRKSRKFSFKIFSDETDSEFLSYLKILVPSIFYNFFILSNNVIVLLNRNHKNDKVRRDNRLKKGGRDFKITTNERAKKSLEFFLVSLLN